MSAGNTFLVMWAGNADFAGLSTRAPVQIYKAIFLFAASDFVLISLFTFHMLTQESPSFWALTIHISLSKKRVEFCSYSAGQFLELNEQNTLFVCQPLLPPPTTTTATKLPEHSRPSHPLPCPTASRFKADSQRAREV